MTRPNLADTYQQTRRAAATMWGLVGHLPLADRVHLVTELVWDWAYQATAAAMRQQILRQLDAAIAEQSATDLPRTGVPHVELDTMRGVIADIAADAYPRPGVYPTRAVHAAALDAGDDLDGVIESVWRHAVRAAAGDTADATSWRVRECVAEALGPAGLGRRTASGPPLHRWLNEQLTAASLASIPTRVPVGTPAARATAAALAGQDSAAWPALPAGTDRLPGDTDTPQRTRRRREAPVTASTAPAGATTSGAPGKKVMN